MKKLDFKTDCGFPQCRAMSHQVNHGFCSLHQKYFDEFETDIVYNKSYCDDCGKVMESGKDKYRWVEGDHSCGSYELIVCKSCFDRHMGRKVKIITEPQFRRITL